MKLYSYWRSTAAYRVRIALNLKQLNYQSIAVNLVKDGGENHQAWYLEKNPTALVPTLETKDGTIMRQSFAIIDYLDKHYPDPQIIPDDSKIRTQVLSFACDIAMEIHPINNLRIITHLKKQYNFDQNMLIQWMHHWMHQSFIAMEKMIDKETLFCFTDSPTLADIFLIPQLYNAGRWQLDMSDYPNLSRINKHALTLSAFKLAHPNRQEDANH